MIHSGCNHSPPTVARIHKQTRTPNMASLIYSALDVLYQSIVCWWSVFQCTTFLCEQLVTSVVHTSTGACSVIYRSTTIRSIAARQLSDISAECEYTSKDWFITWGKLLHVFQADFLNCHATNDVVSHPAKAWKTASADILSACYAASEHNVWLQPVDEQICNGNVSSSKRYPGLSGTNCMEFAGIETQSAWFVPLSIVRRQRCTYIVLIKVSSVHMRRKSISCLKLWQNFSKWMVHRPCITPFRVDKLFNESN